MEFDMTLHRSHLKNIRKAHEEDRLAIFIGAGISKSSDTAYKKMPLWSDLISELKSDLGLMADLEDLDYLKIAQLYFIEFGEHKYNQTLKKYFQDDLSPSTLHKKILEINPKTIITTNWDCLIEKTIEQEGYLYDTICTDKDLVKSTSPNKFVKIHGDFKNHNIVFKEDDYLNYSRDFPLIENYIKSIFSTQTVLFLGYSYNDINLKHIMKWIQSHSKSIPEMYLVSFENNKPQESYLKNHGITTLVINEENHPTDHIANHDKKSAKILAFISSILKEDDASHIKDEYDSISFIYDRIKHLSQQESIAHIQIKKSISNCGFIYDDDGLAILELYKAGGEITNDYDKNIRICHEKFLQAITNLDENSDVENPPTREKRKLKAIMSVLSLAKIKGIVLPKKNGNNQKTYFINTEMPDQKEIEDHDMKTMSYSLVETDENDQIKKLLSESYSSYKTGDYKLSFKKTAELIQECKKRRIYSILLIALFNRNSLLWDLKYSFDPAIRNEFDKESAIELQDEFFKFPRSEIKKNQFLYDFLSLNYIHQKAYECTKKIIELNKAIQIIKNGGLSFNSNADEPNSTHINLLIFSLKNNIMIDNHAAFRSAMRDFVKISILRQSIKKTVVLNQYEIYSAIQFFSEKELKHELNCFFKKEDSSQIMLEVSEKNIEWITSKQLSDISDLLIKNNKLANAYETKFINCIQVLSVMNLDNNSIQKTMEISSRLIASKSTSIAIYESINDFLAHQHHLFKKKIDSEILISMLNTIIDKFISNKTRIYDHHAIKRNSIINLYNYIEVEKLKYTDKDRVKNLIMEINKYSNEDKKDLSKSLLYSIFNISTSDIRKTIKKFIKDIICQQKTDDSYDLYFDIWSVAAGFKEIDEFTIEKIKEYLTSLKNENTFSSSIFNIKEATSFLMEKKGITSLAEVNKIMDDMIETYKSHRVTSFI